MKRCLLLIALLLMLVACNGDNESPDGDTTQPPPQPSPTITTEYIPPDSNEPGLDTAGIPSPRGVIIKDGLTLLAANDFVKDERVYVMFLVRNDSDQTYGNVKALVNFIDQDNLPVSSVDLGTNFSNILPGQRIAIAGNYPIPIDYDGTSTLIIAERDTIEGFSAYLDADTEATLNVADASLTGTATNLGPDPLVLPVAYFLLYGDTEDDILAIIPATLMSGLNNRYWDPNTTLEFEGTVGAVAGDDLSAVSEVELLVAGYVFSSS